MNLTEKVAALVEAESVEPETCFASRERGTIIDLVVNGRTRIYGKTLEECRAEKGYEDAAEMTVEAFCVWKAAQQNAEVEWEPITEARYLEMLNCLPPIAWCTKGFLVGEPWDHHAMTGQPRYQAFRKNFSGYYASSRPLTVSEWRAV
jgi:hypothetical protein